LIFYFSGWSKRKNGGHTFSQYTYLYFDGRDCLKQQLRRGKYR
jgi:hypothetical protein